MNLVLSNIKYFFLYIKEAQHYPLFPNDMNTSGRITLDHKCVCGILLQELENYFRYIIQCDVMDMFF